MKSPFTSRTIWLGILQILIGVCGLLVPFFQTAEFTPAAYVALVSGVLTIILRFLTETPIGFR